MEYIHSPSCHESCGRIIRTQYANPADLDGRRILPVAGFGDRGSLCCSRSPFRQRACPIAFSGADLILLRHAIAPSISQTSPPVRGPPRAA
jgi:hypothetical protein